jgi:hypothetical protein
VVGRRLLERAVGPRVEHHDDDRDDEQADTGDGDTAPEGEPGHDHHRHDRERDERVDLAKVLLLLPR